MMILKKHTKIKIFNHQSKFKTFLKIKTKKIKIIRKLKKKIESNVKN